MKAKYDNPGRVDVEKAAESILDNGGGMNSQQRDGYIHNTVYSKGEGGRQLSWNEYPDGRIGEVHSSVYGKSYTQYKDS